MVGLIPIFANGALEFMPFEAVPSPADRTINPLAVDSADILAWIDAREPVPIGHWATLGREEYARSFTVARTIGYSVIEDLYDGFRATVEAGGTEVDFSARVMPILKRKGWLPDGPDVATRVQLIYDTNLRLARASGRWTRYQRNAATFPYIRGITVRDDRVRYPPKSPHSDHRAWDGIILPVNHPFWTRWWLPLGFRCRCSVIQMTRSQLARWKGGVTSEADLADREARLGEPIFATPAIGVDAQLAQSVTTVNENRLPGMPPVDLMAQKTAGASAWDAILATIANDEIAAIVNSLFGRAA